jgi:hypothetical protein
MKCRHANKLIFEYIDGLISDSDSVRLEQHLGECPTCEATAKGLTKSLDLLHRLPAAEPDENFNWKLRLRIAREKNAFRSGVESERVWMRAWNKRFVISALSTFVVVVAVGFFAIKSAFGPEVPSTAFELQPEEMSKVTAETRKKTTAPSGGVVMPGSGMVGPVLVGTGSPQGWNMDALRGGRPQPTLDVDSLKAHYLKSRVEAYRIRRLQQQIELLQGELDKCDVEKNE